MKGLIPLCKKLIGVIMKGLIVDNYSGVSENELSTYKLINTIIENSLRDNKAISLYFATNFVFFDAFKKLLPNIKKLFDNDLLKSIYILVTSDVKNSLKDFLHSLKNDFIIMDRDDYFLMNLLYKAGVLKVKINYKITNVNSFYFIRYENKLRLWFGTAALSDTAQEDRFELIIPISSRDNKREKSYLNIYKKMWNKSDHIVGSKHIMEILREYANAEVINLNPRSFIASLLITINKEYLVKNISVDLSNMSEFHNMGYYSSIDKLERFGGAILSSTVGYSESFVASMVVKYYFDKNHKTMMLVSPDSRERWSHHLKSSGMQPDQISLLKKSALQSPEFNPENFVGYKLLVIDNAECLFMSDTNENLSKRNLDKLISNNPGLHILLVSSSIINVSMHDLLNVSRCFMRDEFAIKNKEISDKIKQLEEIISNADISNKNIEIIKDVLSAYLVKIDITTGDAPHDMTQHDANKPFITTVKYAYDPEITHKIYERITSSVAALNFEYTKLKSGTLNSNPEVINWYRWRYMRRIDSSLISFIEASKELLGKSEFCLKILSDIDGDLENETLFSNYQIANIKKALTELDDDSKSKVIENIKSDINNLNSLLGSITSIKYLENKDEKITNLLRILNTENKPTIVFSESDDTLRYIKKRLLVYGNFKVEIITGDKFRVDGDDLGVTECKEIDKICGDFNEGKINIILANDSIPEEMRIPKAKVIVNFDLPNDPTILSKRNRKSSTQLNINKVKIYNFQADKRIDKETSLLEELKVDPGVLISYFGIDYIIWCMEEKHIEKIDNSNVSELIILTKDYKDYLSKKNTDEIKKFISTLPAENLVLREFIKFYNLSQETLKLSNVKYKKPFFTSLISDSNYYYVVYKMGETIYTHNNLKFSGVKEDGELNDEELEKITEELKLDKNSGQILGVIRYQS